MKAVAVDPSKKTVRLVDHEAPRLRSRTDVEVQILDVGICGTDREICAFEYGTPPEGSDRLVIGHESLGRVTAVGPDVTRVKVGDLVVPMVRRPCPHEHCTACRAGRQDFCFTGDFLERGIKGAHGFMAERIVDDEIYMNVVPKKLREFAVLVEPLTIAEKAIVQLRQVQQRLPWGCSKSADGSWGHCRKAVVLGAGPVGLLGALALARAGFDTSVYSREQAPNPKAEIVELFGGRYVSAATTPPGELAERLGNIDVVYEAAGASRAAFDLMLSLGTNGVFIFTGVPGRKAPVEIDTDLLMRNLVLKNQVVFGTVNAGREIYEGAIESLGEFVERWPEAVRRLLTGRHATDALEDLLLGAPSGIKNVMSFAETTTPTESAAPGTARRARR